MGTTFKVGISTCLLGEPVRWNGGHKRDPFLVNTLGDYVEYVPVCPETECGLGIPRETMHLEGNIERPRLVTHKTKIDHTERMEKWAYQRVKDLEKEDLCGFIFKKDSPSSGLMRVKVRNEKGMPMRKGVGIFARIFTEHFPLIPVEEEGRLHDPVLRENFITRIFTMQRWRETLNQHKNMGGLVAFHTIHKLLILSHSQAHYREMGKLVAAGKQYPLEALFEEYEALLMKALALKTTLKKNLNVLQHLLGYFKKNLSADEKQELLTIFDHYRKGIVPLIVPITLINHYVRKYQQPYLKEQIYLNPHPLELKLRNHA
jgi:uncharacterized protein YbgA (DUF1722 family)/uncharacterized protein YbbK (DUF523 family)